jgi:hypothetical protein
MGQSPILVKIYIANSFVQSSTHIINMGLKFSFYHLYESNVCS